MKPSIKKSLAQQREESKAGMRMWASAFGKSITADILPLPEKAKKERVKSDIPTESKEQIMFVKFWRQQYPKYRIFAIPNGGARDAITGSIMRAEGVTPGVLDLFIPRCKLWVEMKRRVGGRISEEQQDWADYLTHECGHTVIFAYGFDDALVKVGQFMKQFLHA